MSLVDPFMTPNQQRVLSAILLNPNKTYSLSDLIRASGGGHGGTQIFINKLHKTGIVLDERVGNQRRFRANTEFPIYTELRGICVKSFGVAERVKEMLHPYADDIGLAFVFGSIAKGTDKGGSDIDVLVVGNVDLIELMNAAAVLGSDLGREVNVNQYSKADWKKALAQDSIVKSIVGGPKLMVIGNDPATDGDRQSHRDWQPERG